MYKRQVQGQFHVLAHSHQAAQIGAALDDKVAPSRFPGLLGAGLCIQAQGAALDAAAPGAIFQGQTDVLGLQMCIRDRSNIIWLPHFLLIRIYHTFRLQDIDF